MRLFNKRGNMHLVLVFVIIVILVVSIIFIRNDYINFKNKLNEEDNKSDNEIDDGDTDDGDSSDNGDSSDGGSSSGPESYFNGDADLIHLVLGDSPNSSIKIIWVTGDDGEENNTVLYHKDGAGVNLTKTGSSVRLADTTDFVHVVELNNLDISSIYYFYCSGVSQYSAERKFKTTGNNLSNFTVISDTQGLGEEFTNLSTLMAVENPEFIVVAGDHVSHSDDMDDWIEYFDIIEEIWITDANITLAQIPILGNHDDSSEWFWQFFDLTENSEWCSYEWSNHIIVALNSVDDDLVDDQVSFLTNAVNTTKNVTVSFHHNIYESPIKSEQDEIVEFWVPIFEEYNVSTVIHGHEHRYYRSNKTNGVVYMCDGAGGGSPRDELPPDSLEIDHYEAAYSYVLFDISNNMLYAKDIDETTFDSHAIVE